ncbi:MAG: ribonuclease H-like domain-containing protein [Micrococcaceae bacterium]
MLGGAAKYLDHSNSEIAEFAGLLLGVKLVHAIDDSASYILYCDNKSVVDIMNMEPDRKLNEKRNSEVLELIQEIDALNKGDKVLYVCQSRTKNKIADALANYAIDNKTNFQTCEEKIMKNSGLEKEYIAFINKIRTIKDSEVAKLFVERKAVLAQSKLKLERNSQVTKKMSTSCGQFLDKVVAYLNTINAGKSKLDTKFKWPKEISFSFRINIS